MSANDFHSGDLVVSDSFTDLWQRLKGGDSTAAADLFDRYAQRLIALARKRIDSRLQRREDAEDIVQSVLVSFFRRQADGRIQPRGWHCLWGYLAAMTVRKLGHHLDFHRADCRDVERERVCPLQLEDSRSGWEVIAAEPTPEQAAILADLLEVLMRSLCPQHRPIVRLAMEGCTQPEIAHRQQLSLRTVERVLKSVRDQWAMDLSPDQTPLATDAASKKKPDFTLGSRVL